MCSVKKVFLEISQSLEGNTYARVSFLLKKRKKREKKQTLTQVFSCEFYEISKNIFFDRTPLDDCFWNHLNLFSVPKLSFDEDIQFI